MTLWKSAAQSLHFHFLAQLIGFCKSRYYERLRGKTIYIYITSTERGTWFVYPADHGMLQRSLFFCFRIMSEAKHPWRTVSINPSKHHLFLSVRYLRYQEHATIMYFAAFTVRISTCFERPMRYNFHIMHMINQCPSATALAHFPHRAHKFNLNPSISCREVCNTIFSSGHLMAAALDSPLYTQRTALFPFPDECKGSIQLAVVLIAGNPSYLLRENVGSSYHQ